MTTQTMKKDQICLTTQKCPPQTNPLPKSMSQKLIFPQRQINDYMSVRQYVKSDPPTIKLRQFIKDTNGTPFVARQQQIEKAHIKTYKIVHNDRPGPYYEKYYTKDFETQFRPLQLIEDYNPQYIDPEYGKDPYWNNDLYDKANLQFKC